MLSKPCMLAAASLVFLASPPARAQTSSSKAPAWQGTWATSPMLAEGGTRRRPFSDVTLREIAHISIGGQQVRARFTNEFGTDPLTITDAHIAVSDGGPAIKPGTDHPLAFGGATTVRIPPGAALLSDPVSLDVAPLSDLAVSFHIPAQNMRTETFHDFADQDSYMADGNVASAAKLSEPSTLSSWYFFDGIDVEAHADPRAIVTLGDSITDGAHSTRNANHRWPDVLAQRLTQGGRGLSVLNEGIGGNRILNEGAGPNALSRFDRDVLAQDGVRFVIFLEGINDIGRLRRVDTPDDDIDAKQLELALKQMADSAHEHGIQAIGATMTPYDGAGYYSDRGEGVRQAVNDWIRNSGTFDNVIDFDKITRDPQNPNRFNPQYDSGDHLHPNDAGYQAMGSAIDLKILAR